MRTRGVLTWACVLALAWAIPTTAVWAGKPGGGGGAVPPGRIYFRDLATGVLVGMDGSGGSREVLVSTRFPRASRLTHGGVRWILHLDDVPGEDGPGPVTRSELFATREDGTVSVRLTSDPTIQYWKDHAFDMDSHDWAPDEDASGATIGVIARKWTGTSPTDTVIPSSCGLYTARLEFDADGSVAGLTAEPSLYLFVGTTGPAGNERADMTSFSWSPDMARLAFARNDEFGDPELRVADLAQGTITTIGPGDAPDWAPDGRKIACSRTVPGAGLGKSVIETVLPDGSGRTTLVSLTIRAGGGRQRYARNPKWSPDGGYLAYNDVYFEGPTATYFVRRVSASGTGDTNLTPEVKTPSSGTYFSGALLIDWR